MTLNASPIGTPVTTPQIINPDVPSSQISFVPIAGTGLSGEVYAPGDWIGKLEHLEEIIETNTPDATFTATQIAYGGNRSDTTIAEFLGDDAASLIGDGELEMGPSGLRLTGYIYIPAGEHEVSVYSDDGFALALGGVEFSEFTGRRGTDETARTENFEGGLYAIEILYFDSGGGQSLGLSIDGLPVLPSAFYGTLADFLNPPAGTVLVPASEYHPSQFLDAAVDDPSVETGTEGRDIIYAEGGNDTINALGGDDELFGGYGDDALFGGDGDDVMDGGRGSDYLSGGDGNDLLIARSDAGEQRIGQLAIGEPTRGDPDGEVNPDRQKLYGWEDMPLVSDDILEGGDGRDTFLLAPQINGKLDIIKKHVRSDGTINWAGVAGENNELHDHWVDAKGFDVIADFVASDDSIAVIGHTANVSVDHYDTDNDGDDESIISIYSQQHGGGGAHTQDLIGITIVHGDRVEEEMIQTDANVTYGIVETFAEVAEALFPVGDLKVTEIAGEQVYGYDTREPGGVLGPVTGNPEDYVDNPYDDLVTFGDPVAGFTYEETRDPFEPLGFIEVTGVRESATGRADVWSADGPEAPGMEAPLAHWDFAGPDGAYADNQGGQVAKAYTLYENQARLRTDGVVEGPDGALNALSFNGEDEFAFIAHDPDYQITQGSITLWVQPQDLTSTGVFVSKDQRGAGEGGHFRLGHTSDGGLLLRMAPGDGGGNKGWTTGPLLTQGTWQHLAVNFTETGVFVYLDGKKVPSSAWTPVEGDVPTPETYLEAFFLNNKEPWVLGADQRLTELNETAQQFGTDDEDLDNPFEGAIADFALFGGYSATDALTRAEIQHLATPGFDIGKLTKATGPQPIIAADDTFFGLGGDDSVDGGAGDDSLSGGGGNDSIQGGYGDDIVDGGDGNDTLDGGRGSDLVIGGAGNDVLIARSDTGEDRAGQLVLGEPSRPFPDPQIDNSLLKLADWLDQPLVADDILVGGAGNDHFKIETLINGTREAITDNLMSGERMIHWGGVAGENARIHAHWVDGIGIDVIADFVKGEDTISIIGHTTNVEITHRPHDSNDDGVDDTAVSVITVYSQQGRNGGAHDEDYLGYVVVHGDLVEEDDVITDAGVHYGIVDTVDQLQEALAPSGDTKTREWNGQELFGYDSRDVEGDPIGSDPEAFAENPYADLVSYGDTVVTDLPELGLVLEDDGGSYNGDIYGTIAHTPSMQQETGTIAFSFTADAPGGRDQALLSKDHSGHKTGGHFTAWVGTDGYLRVRFQDDTDISRYLKYRDEQIVAGETYDIAFSFDDNTLALFVNGEMVDAEDGFPGGMLGNTEEILVGASARRRDGLEDRAEWYFEGSITDIMMFDRSLTDVEAVLLEAAEGDFSALPSTELFGPREILGTNIGEVLLGTVEEDVILGLDGSDDIDADAGNDIVFGGADHDTVDGGAGDDSLFGSKGADSIDGGWGDDFIAGNAGADLIYGGHDDDSILGNEFADVLYGWSGNDDINGGAGQDLLYGGMGEDTLDGGASGDTLTGGLDADVFVFTVSGGIDRITDWEDGVDVLDFTADGLGFNDFAISTFGGGAGTKLIGGGYVVFLEGVPPADVDASDFL
ncbi:MAG: LamG-like jellyroll fold domain-containing protein [Pseudomonadota bacterium]